MYTDNARMHTDIFRIFRAPRSQHFFMLNQQIKTTNYYNYNYDNNSPFGHTTNMAPMIW